VVTGAFIRGKSYTLFIAGFFVRAAQGFLHTDSSGPAQYLPR
jgi:hypothetical protein